MKAKLDWTNLSFGYIKTDYNVRSYYRGGEWGELEVHSEETINLHISATAIHYGQQSFEGMKVFEGKDGKARIFRWEDNAQRMIDSVKGIMMQPVTKELFWNAIEKAIKMNSKYIPPYGSGASLYVRPLLIGSGPQLGLRPAEEYMFMVFVSPVGPYFKEGFKPVDVLIVRDKDRAAPQGTGHLKVGGNYAGSLAHIEEAHQGGYATSMYLDAKEKKYIDECGPANFFGIKGDTYVTPKSDSILSSITNKSLMQLAEDMGMKVERRKVSVEELQEFDEVGACGTAAVISPLKKIVDNKTGETYEYCADGKAGPVSTKLFEKLQGIQYGDESDKHNWVTVVRD